MKGYEIIAELKPLITKKDIIVSCPGNISREVYHLIDQPQVYLRGSMGLQIAVGLGIAVEEKEKDVMVILGDGSFLMGMSSIVTAAFYQPKNLKILILDNAKYFTTGGQETTSSALNFSIFFKALNASFKKSTKAIESNIKQDLIDFTKTKGFAILHLEIEEGKKELTNIPWHPEEITDRIKQLFKL
jgi:thiamine pyrophosphate-dependent acetolactate synthase large subunit-like protein